MPPKVAPAPAPPDEILETYRARIAEVRRTAIGGALEVSDYSAAIRYTARQCHVTVTEVGTLVLRMHQEGAL